MSKIAPDLCPKCNFLHDEKQPCKGGYLPSKCPLDEIAEDLVRQEIESGRLSPNMDKMEVEF